MSSYCDLISLLTLRVQGLDFPWRHRKFAGDGAGPGERLVDLRVQVCGTVALQVGDEKHSRDAELEATADLADLSPSPWSFAVLPACPWTSARSSLL